MLSVRTVKFVLTDKEREDLMAMHDWVMFHKESLEDGGVDCESFLDDIETILVNEFTD